MTPEAFYSPANRLLFEVVVDLYQNSRPITIEVLAEELKTRRKLLKIAAQAEQGTFTTAGAPRRLRPGTRRVRRSEEHTSELQSL